MLKLHSSRAAPCSYAAVLDQHLPFAPAEGFLWTGQRMGLRSLEEARVAAMQIDTHLHGCLQVSLNPAYAGKIYAKDRGDRFPDEPSDLDAEPQSLAYAFQDG